MKKGWFFQNTSLKGHAHLKTSDFSTLLTSHLSFVEISAIRHLHYLIWIFLGVWGGGPGHQDEKRHTELQFNLRLWLKLSFITFNKNAD